MTLLNLVPLGLFAIAFAALAARFALPRLSLAASGELADAHLSDLSAAPAGTRFGGDRGEAEAREPAVAAFPRAF